jgi:hypothetical protein
VSARRPRPAGIRQAVQTAVGAVHSHRPSPGTAVGEQAVWWHQKAGALDLIAEHEADATRAHTARSDADVARRLARGLALTHTEALTHAATDLRPPAQVSESTDDDADELEASWR